MLPKPVVSFAAYFNKITSVLNFRLFSGIVLLISKDTCMVPAGFTLAEHSYHGTVPWQYYANHSACFLTRLLLCITYLPTLPNNIA